MGLLDRHILDSGYSLTEGRVLFELGETGRCIANDLAVRLRMDKSYLSRILAKFEKQGLVRREVSGGDGRAYYIELTETGSRSLRALSEKSNRQIRQLFFGLSGAECEAVRAAMHTIQSILIKAQDVTVRPYRPQDLPFVVTRQINLYEEEYGFTSPVWRTYVTDAVHSFFERFDEEKDCMCMLEHRGVLSGCIAVAHAQDETAQLRFFFLEPAARGFGFGGKLIELALSFCKEKQYRHIYLLTCNKLDAARYLYKKHGFRITGTHENDEWGETMQEERWELELPAE